MMYGYWPMGGMSWIWMILLFGCGSLFFWYRPRHYRRYRSLRHYGYMRNEDPLDLASARLAKGEITFEEYEKIKKAILDS